MQNVLKRAWVKNVAIIFLTALLVLTFFSNTIMNRSLPEVATQGVSSGPITARVRGTGKVTAVGAYELKIDQTRKVQSVLVRAGQEVSAGDVLFVLGEGASEELEQAAETLRQLELSYKRAAAGMPIQNYTQADREIAAAREELQLAKSAYERAEAALKQQMAKDKAMTAIDDYNKMIEEAENRLSAAQAKLEDVRKEVAAAKEEAWTELQKLQLKQRVYDAREAELAAEIGNSGQNSGGGIDNNGGNTGGTDNNNGGSTGGGTDNNNGGSTGGSSTDNNGGSTGGGTDNNNGGSTGGSSTDNNGGSTGGGSTDNNNGGSTGGSSTDNNTGGSTGGGSTDNNSSSTDNNNGSTDNNNNGGTDNNNGGSPDQISAAGKLLMVNLAPVKLRTIFFGLSTVGMTNEEIQLVNQYENELNAILSSISDKNEQLQKVRELKAQITTEINNIQAQLNMNADARIERANEDVASAQANLDALLKRFGTYADNYIKARDELAAAQKKLADLEDNKKQMGRSAASASIELQDLSEQIARAKQKLEELAGGTDNQITAPVGGIIESIGYTAGNTAPKGEILCTIQVPDMGYTLSFSVTNEQARRLRTGDSATVSNYYWGSEVLATLATIQTDPQAPQTNKLLTFDVTGDVNPGSELTISVGSRSQNYDVIVPNSAIRSDTNGSFVLRLEAKNSPLGNRYFARRVEVTVLGQDDVNSAVSGDLSWGDFIITTSDRPVNVGDQVRMSDNG